MIKINFMKISRYSRRLMSNFLFSSYLMAGILLSIDSAVAQSLDPNRPTPLQPGVNRGTVDSFVGPHYWQFTLNPGDTKLIIHFTSMGVLGAPSPATIRVTLRDTAGKSTSVELTSTGQTAELVLPGKAEARKVWILEIHPPLNTLVRTGGDYDIQVIGDVDYASGSNNTTTNVDAIVGTYSLMICPPGLQCGAVRFFADGTVKASDGNTGTWKVFDPEARIYVVLIGSHKFDVKLIPGLGLVKTSDTDVIVFQAVR